jgi:hypothetical protein
MIHEYEINGMSVRTGDVICTADAGPPMLAGQFWRYIGNLLPGEIGHVAVYVGPEGRCVEAGAKGKVIMFSVPDNVWDPAKMREQRGEVVDTFYGVACPLEGRGLSDAREAEVRESVARFCLAQAEAGKPYNLDFFNSKTSDAFYCSQLVHMAYSKNGIELRPDAPMPSDPRTRGIISPQEIWNGCVHKKYESAKGKNRPVAAAGRLHARVRG